MYLYLAAHVMYKIDNIGIHTYQRYINKHVYSMFSMIVITDKPPLEFSDLKLAYTTG